MADTTNQALMAWGAAILWQPVVGRPQKDDSTQSSDYGEVEAERWGSVGQQRLSKRKEFSK